MPILGLQNPFIGNQAAGCPTYTPPAGNAVICDFTASYTPPSGNNIQFEFCVSQ